MRRLKILAIAYACNPNKGSESGVGWGWVNAIAANHNITVITADYNRADISSELERRDDFSAGNPRFIYVKNLPWHYRPQGIWLGIENSFAKPLMNFAYQNWLKYAYLEAEQELARNRYDLVHLITYVGWRFPGKFYQLGIPFVWGPIGGMKNTPWRLLHILGIKGAIYYGARNLINSVQIKTLPGPRRAMRTSNQGLIAATSEIQKEMWTQFKVKSQVICEVGPPDFTVAHPSHRNKDEPLRICWSGQLLPGKALHLLLQAAAQLPGELNYTIDILGGGHCCTEWQTLAARLSIQDWCRWHGWIPRNRSLAIMQESHVFVITSLKDLTSTVAVEAISLGLPIVCLDHCGFADLVTDDCGIKVFPGSARQIISDLANALLILWRDEDRRQRLAEGALRRSQDYAWQKKMESLNQIYVRAIQAQGYRAGEGHDDLAL